MFKLVHEWNYLDYYLYSSTHTCTLIGHPRDQHPGCHPDPLQKTPSRERPVGCYYSRNGTTATGVCAGANAA